MNPKAIQCSFCGDLLVEVEAALNRDWLNVLFTSFGSSELQIRTKSGSWMPFMKPSRSAQGLYCTKCGALTIAPSISGHRKALGLEP
jgi:phage FluMu protein Com